MCTYINTHAHTSIQYATSTDGRMESAWQALPIVVKTIVRIISCVELCMVGIHEETRMLLGVKAWRIICARTTRTKRTRINRYRWCMRVNIDMYNAYVYTCKCMRQNKMWWNRKHVTSVCRDELLRGWRLLLNAEYSSEIRHDYMFQEGFAWLAVHFCLGEHNVCMYVYVCIHAYMNAWLNECTGVSNEFTGVCFWLVFGWQVIGLMRSSWCKAHCHALDFVFDVGPELAEVSECMRFSQVGPKLSALLLLLLHAQALNTQLQQMDIHIDIHIETHL